MLLLNQYSPVPRARSSTAGKDATQQRPVCAHATRAQIYAGLRTINYYHIIEVSRPFLSPLAQKNPKGTEHEGTKGEKDIKVPKI